MRSVIVTVKEQVLVFPDKSVPVNVFKVTPEGKGLPDINPVVCVTVTGPQLSNAINVNEIWLLQLVTDAFMLMGCGQKSRGGTESITVIRVKQRDVFPAVSVAVNPTLSVP